MKKTVLIIMILTFVSKGIGFFRDIILSYYYGASSISDVYLISLVIPSVIFGFIGTGLSNAYIPMYSEIENKYGVKKADRFTNNIITIFLIFSTIICFICYGITEPLVKIFASGFEGDTLQLAVSFTRISILSIYFTGIILILSGYLQIKGNHIAPSLIGLPLNFALILSIIFSSLFSIMILPYGKISAVILQFAFLMFFVNKKGFKYKPVLEIKNNHVRKMMVLSLPIILGSSVEQINRLVDRTIASTIVVGGISALNYANQLNLFVQGIFVASISVVFYPVISKMAAQENVLELKKSVSKTIISINLFLIPATIGTIIFSEQIVSLLFGRGAFTNQAIYLTSSALLFYSIGMVGFGIREVLTKAFYALQDTRTPTINSIISITLNIFLNLILSRLYGISGLALATSISALVCTILLFSSLWKKVGIFDLKNLVVSFLKILSISVLMGAFCYVAYSILSNMLHVHIALLISVFLGIIFYGVLINFMKISEIDDFIHGLKRKWKKTNTTKGSDA